MYQMPSTYADLDVHALRRPSSIADRDCLPSLDSTRRPRRRRPGCRSRTSSSRRGSSPSSRWRRDGLHEVVGGAARRPPRWRGQSRGGVRPARTADDARRTGFDDASSDAPRTAGERERRRDGGGGPGRWRRRARMGESPLGRRRGPETVPGVGASHRTAAMVARLRARIRPSSRACARGRAGALRVRSETRDGEAAPCAAAPGSSTNTPVPGTPAPCSAKPPLTLRRRARSRSTPGAAGRRRRGARRSGRPATSTCTAASPGR